MPGAELLVLDEATAGLDPIARDEFLDQLRAFASAGDDGQGRGAAHGVLLSSHITSDLERIADRVVAIDAGRIAFDVPREDITDTAGIAHCASSRASEVLSCVDDAPFCFPTVSISPSRSRTSPATMRAWTSTCTSSCR